MNGEIVYHYSALTQVQGGMAYTDGTFSVRATGALNLNELREHIAKIFREKCEPISGVTITSLTAISWPVK